MKISNSLLQNLLFRIKRKIAKFGRNEDQELYALWEKMHLKNLFKEFDVDCVFDVGANTGQYATMLRQDIGFKGRIISFEPNPEDAQKLRIAADVDPLWDVQELALAATGGTQDFNIMKVSQFSSLSQPRTDQLRLFHGKNKIDNVITVKTENLSTIFDKLHSRYCFSRPFLKLDTQGNDIEIVKHALPTMKAFVGLQSELAISKLYEASVDFREALTFYEECGFELSAFVPNNEGHFPRLVEIDCIMIRSDLLALTD